MSNTLSAGQMKLIMTTLTNSIPSKELLATDVTSLVGKGGILGEKLRHFWSDLINELHDSYSVRGPGDIRQAMIENELEFALPTTISLEQFIDWLDDQQLLKSIPADHLLTFVIKNIDRACQRNVRQELRQLGYRSATLGELISFTMAKESAVYGRVISIVDKVATDNDKYWVHTFTPDDPDGPTKVFYLPQSELNDDAHMCVLAVKL